MDMTRALPNKRNLTEGFVNKLKPKEETSFLVWDEHTRGLTVICVTTFDKNTQMVRLLNHKVFQPSPDNPLDFELTIESYLLDLKKRFQLRLVRYDPYQMVATAQRLAKQGVPIEEFPQTVPNLTAASQNLFDLIESQGTGAVPRPRHAAVGVSCGGD
jgi:hypothetical protein